MSPILPSLVKASQHPHLLSRGSVGLGTWSLWAACESSDDVQSRARQLGFSQGVDFVGGLSWGPCTAVLGGRSRRGSCGPSLMAASVPEVIGPPSLGHTGPPSISNRNEGAKPPGASKGHTQPDISVSGAFQMEGCLCQFHPCAVGMQQVSAGDPALCFQMMIHRSA